MSTPLFKDSNMFGKHSFLSKSRTLSKEVLGDDLILWIDAKDSESLELDENSRVVKWNDKSGLENHLETQGLANTALFENESVKFVSAEKTGYMIPFSFPANCSFIVVSTVQQQNNANGSSLRPIISFSPHLRGFLGSPFDFTALREDREDNDRIAFWNQNGNNTQPFVNRSLNEIAIYNGQYSYQGNDIFFNVKVGKNLDDNTTDNQDRSFDAEGNGLMSLGFDYLHEISASGARYYQGYIHEVIMFSKVIEDRKLFEIKRILVKKWGIEL